MSISATTRENLSALLRSLSEGERLFLKEALEENLSPAPRKTQLSGFALPATDYLTTAQLDAVKDALHTHMYKAKNARERLSRFRLLICYILARYAALRLNELLAFDDMNDFFPEKHMILCKGSHARQIALPPDVCAELRQALANPLLQSKRGTLTHFDEGYLRRNLYICATWCKLPKTLLSIRSIRNSRAVELCREGMPLHILYSFLGMSASEKSTFVQYSPTDTQNMVHQHLQREMSMKTSARNVFPGRIIRLRQQDFLVEVELVTLSGLHLSAIITEGSSTTLGLHEDKILIATIKAPWIHLSVPAKKDTSSNSALPQANHFQGTVTRIRSATLAKEVLVTLSDGSTICAVSGLEDIPDSLSEGDPVHVSFSPFAVILGLG